MAQKILNFRRLFFGLFLFVLLTCNDHGIDAARQQRLPSASRYRTGSDTASVVHLDDDDVDDTDYIPLTNSSPTEELPPSTFQCPEKFGYYPDLKNCSRYHICDHGRATDKSCDDGLVFSTILKTCDWPYNVHCNLLNGERGDYSGVAHLRLSDDQPRQQGNSIDPSSVSNRRQPVLTNEADDSYWLGRPDTSLLAALNDEDYTHDHDYHGAGFVDTARRQPKNQQQRPPVHREEEPVEDEPLPQHPWFQNVNFENSRRASARTTTTTTTTPAPTTTPFPSVSTNQRTGWRQHSRFRNPTPAPSVTTTTPKPQSLQPRRAFRVGGHSDEEDFLLTDDPVNVRLLENDLPGDYRRTAPNKDDRDSYRIVSHQRHHEQTTTTIATTTTTTTTPRPTPWAFAAAITAKTSTASPAIHVGSRPRHLGSSVRRKVVRKKVVPAGTFPTIPPTTTTPAPTTTPGRSYPAWNDLNDQWKSVRFAERPSVVQSPPLEVNTGVRRGIPKIDGPKRQRFERKPVLLRNEEENYDEPDQPVNGEDEGYYFPSSVEIRKKNRTIDALEPKTVVKDVPNSLTGGNVRFKVGPQPPPPPPPLVQSSPRISPNSNLHKAFNVGFHHAVNPGTFGGGSGGSAAADIEYEDMENEDEDENTDSGSDSSEETDDTPVTNANAAAIAAGGERVRQPNKEIIVRYDDDPSDDGQSPPPPVARRHGAVPIPTVPPSSRAFAPTIGFSHHRSPPTPTPPHLTRLIGPPLNAAGFAHPNNLTGKPSPKSSAVRIVDLTEAAPPHHAAVLEPLLPPPFVSFGLLNAPPAAVNQSFPRTEIPPKWNPQPPYAVGVSSPLAIPPKMKKIKSKKPKISSGNSNHKKYDQIIPKKYPTGETFYSRAKRCDPERCQLPYCRCGGIDIPGGYRSNEIPQIVLLTFDDSVNDLNKEIYRRLFESGRKNPNGCPISATFYVSHEWTDYSQVQNLYSKGHEIASHSISHSFGEKFSKERWYEEIVGQKKILSLYGGVHPDDIRGMRAPFLQTGGDTMFEMLHRANFSYDSSLPVYDIDPPYWPYTFDFAIGHDCMIEPCPTNSYPGLWEVGMVMWEDLRGGRCSMADGCFNPSDEQGVYEMVKANFLRHYTSNRAPFGMYFHSRWFLTEHNMNGFIRFLDEMLELDDIYLVTNHQMIQWMQNPTPLSLIKKFTPFGCSRQHQRPGLCTAPHSCKARFRGEVRTLRTCQQCPQTYPWTGNNAGNGDT